MRFLLLADCQLGAYATFSGMDSAEVAAFADRDMRVESVPRVEGFAWDAERYERSIDVANRLRPGFVVVAGDMIDDLSDPGQIAELQRITALLDPEIEMRWVAGNHDAAFDTTTPTETSLRRYREVFGPDRYTFDQGDTRFVVVNTTILDHPELVPDEHAEQMEFLEHELGVARSLGRRTVLLGHHPLFLTHPEEEDSYWNLPRERRREVLALVHRFEVPIAFAGHWHRNSIGYDRDFEMVTTGPVGYPLGDDPSGYRVVELGATITHDYRPLPDVP